MKIVKFLDPQGTELVSDPINQTILKDLVTSEHSISELATKLNISPLKLWRRIQKLAKANLVEITRIEKVGNIEKKFYRSTATWFAPQQYFDFAPKDTNLKEAFEIYSEIQKCLMIETSTLGDIPAKADPIDYANMKAFATVCSEPQIQARIQELKCSIEKFEEKSSFT
jgi:DNA-binding Lrp family transcriptional regulator